MVIEKIRAIASQFSDKNAIIYDEHRIGYRQLEEITNKLATGLKKAGIKTGDRVALMMPNFPHFVFSYYAVLKLGAIIVPINYMMEDDEFDETLASIKSSAIIYWEGFRQHIRKYIEATSEPLIVIVLGEKKSLDQFNLLELMAQSNAVVTLYPYKGDETAVIQFTSGVTEPPKGIELSHENLMSSIDACANFFHFNEFDVFGAVLPLSFIFSQNVLLNTALTRGGTVVLHSKLDYEKIAHSIDKHKISVLAGSPNFYNKLVELATQSVTGASLQYCISSWSQLPGELESKFEQRFGIPLLNCYSITETGGIVAANHPSFERRKGSVGLALSNISIQVHDEQGETLDHNKVGEIVIQGKNVMKNYWNSPELTEARLRQGWYYTGDLGKIDEQGNIFLISKKAEVIVKSGFPIYTSEIEQILVNHPKVREAVVMAIPHPDHKEDVQACLALKDNETATPEEIIDYCRSQMPVYKCPQIVKFYPALPRTKMGRIFKRKLQAN